MAIKVANNQSLTAITALPSAVSGGAMTLLETQTASSSATLSFTSGIDSTYDEYVFKFYDIHPQNDDKHFYFNGSIDAGSNYNVTKTTTSFAAYHNEGGSDAALAYQTGGDLAQATGFQTLTIGDKLGNDNDQNLAGYLRLFNPSSTTFVKNFLAETSVAGAGNYNSHAFFGGYFNTTSAIDAIQFKAETGAIESGVIKLYGIS